LGRLIAWSPDNSGFAPLESGAAGAWPDSLLSRAAPLARGAASALNARAGRARGPCRGETYLERSPATKTGGGGLTRQTSMAGERAQNLQDTFLNHVRKNKVPLTIFLVNGVKLQGVVTWFDNFCVLLRRDGHSQLVYKHAISTIMPGHPIQLFEQGDDPEKA
jgi:host factor-I protein